MKYKITILWALPASGKSTYAAKHDARKNYYKRSRIIDLDRLFKNKPTYIENAYDFVARDVLDHIEWYQRYYPTHNNKTDLINDKGEIPIILDGLITTNENAKKLIEAIKKDFSNREAYTIYKENPSELIFEIVFWEKDIDSCLWNDFGRRKVQSRITIENLPFEEPSKELLKEFNINLIRKLIVRKSAAKLWMHATVGSESLKSSTWCLGGNGKNCWGDEWTIHSTSQPASFREFDDLLTNICPSITFLQYKKIYEESVSIEESSEGDYYGGNADYACYSCDLEKLYQSLLEMRLIAEITDLSQIIKED